jgi:hypothetical protein
MFISHWLNQVHTVHLFNSIISTKMINDLQFTIDNVFVMHITMYYIRMFTISYACFQFTNDYNLYYA